MRTRGDGSGRVCRGTAAKAKVKQDAPADTAVSAASRCRRAQAGIGLHRRRTAFEIDEPSEKALSPRYATRPGRQHILRAA